MLNWEDTEGSSCLNFKVLSQHVPGVYEENL
jgi:hypothetical protein